LFFFFRLFLNLSLNKSNKETNMKSSIHLFYGIIIGILAMFCVGQKQEDKKEFKEEKFHYLDELALPASVRMDGLRKEGWTLIDWELDADGSHYVHIGR
jgi:hypothetical protein